MTLTRRLLRLEAVEERCLPSGYRPEPAVHRPPAAEFETERVETQDCDDPRGGQGRSEDRDVSRSGRTDDRSGPNRSRAVELQPVAAASPQVAFGRLDAVRLAPQVSARSEMAGPMAGGDPVMAISATRSDLFDPSSAEPAGDDLATAAELPGGFPDAPPPPFVHAVQALLAARLVSAVVAEPPVTRVAESAPTADRPAAVTGVTPPSESSSPPQVIAAGPVAAPPPAGGLVDVSTPPVTAAPPVWSPLLVLPSDPVPVPDPDPVQPPPTDPPPAVVVAQAAAAAIAPPLLPLVGVVPVDLVAVEQAAAELLAQLTAVADPADGWSPAARWGWVGAAVVAAGGLVHATRPAADRKHTPPGADSALARWESRHARR